MSMFIVARNRKSLGPSFLTGGTCSTTDHTRMCSFPQAVRKVRSAYLQYKSKVGYLLYLMVFNIHFRFIQGRMDNILTLFLICFYEIRMYNSSTLILKNMLTFLRIMLCLKITDGTVSLNKDITVTES